MQCTRSEHAGTCLLIPAASQACPLHGNKPPLMLRLSPVQWPAQQPQAVHQPVCLLRHAGQQGGQHDQPGAHVSAAASWASAWLILDQACRACPMRPHPPAGPAAAMMLNVAAAFGWMAAPRGHCVLSPRGRRAGHCGNMECSVQDASVTCQSQAILARACSACCSTMLLLQPLPASRLCSAWGSSECMHLTD